MTPNARFTRLGFIKSYLLPALVIFLIPGLGLWFSIHYVSSLDAKTRDGMVGRINADSNLSELQKQEASDFYKRVPLSRIMASNAPETQELRDQFRRLRGRYDFLRWTKQVSAASILAALGAFALVGISVWISFRSQQVQYWSLRIGWTFLRWLALFEVVCQGIVLIALCFLVPAEWFDLFIGKLVAIAAIMAGGAVWLLIKVIFVKISLDYELEGERVTREQAPLLWAKIDSMSERMGIAPPDHLFTGINDQFFVTEQPGKAKDQIWNGRILFASLALLRTLTKSEAEAVLAHELAHFSGEDTLYSKRISPLLIRFEHYLGALLQGGVSIPVFCFMFLFWNLFRISLGRTRREREIRADKIGAQFTSATDMSNALVKSTAYARFRRQVQQTVFDEMSPATSAKIRDRIDRGFPDFVRASTQNGELAVAHLSHPFDSHPPLETRLKNLGINPEKGIQPPLEFPTLEETWYAAIGGAAQIEEDQWNAFEQVFQKQHDEALAWRYEPETDSEREHVLKYFPARAFHNAKDYKVTYLNFDSIQAPDWDKPVAFEAIKACRFDKSWGKNLLFIDCHPAEDRREQRVKLNVEKLQGAEQFVETFQKYYKRHLTSRRGKSATTEPIGQAE